jgi:23S rRNA (cytosine1962-C5)-methyltransferase
VTERAGAAGASPGSDEATVTVSRRGAERIASGHPWVYRSDVEAPRGLPGGAVVRVADRRGFFLGRAFFGARSQIVLRMLTREDVPVDRGFFAGRLARALALRERLPAGAEAARLVHGEADLLPGVVVDRYRDHLVLQTLIEGSEKHKELLVDLLWEALQPACIVERNDAKTRQHEGLALQKGVLRGAYGGPVAFREGEVTLLADLIEGQKTGAFLDQAENRVASERYARGRALDCFSYGGAFALHLARGAERVIAVEISEKAAEDARAAAARNGASNLEMTVANAFDFLRERADAGERFDTIVLDPPAFARSRQTLPAALRGYKEINLRAMILLAPGGTLITSSCSYHVDAESFEAMLAEAAADAGRAIQVVERRGAARDHPSMLGIPETRYLKCFILRAP